MSPTFTCRTCGRVFTVPQAALDKYPAWRPARCRQCRDVAEVAAMPTARTPTRADPLVQSPTATADRESAPGCDGHVPVDEHLAVIETEVRARHAAGPRDGVFTDGACSGNPGPGGWAAVHVKEDRILAQASGGEPRTTNNRMELTALIAGLGMIEPDEAVVVWSDSQLCVNTINEWAPAWERRGWRRKGGEIKNLELVQELYALARARPRAQLRWIKAHDGSRWNEYVDAVSTWRIDARRTAR
jgi:ribonuclease HI